MKSFFKCLSLLLLFCLSAANLEAKGTESLETFKPVESPFIRAPKKIKKTARIRIGIKLSPYEKIVVRGHSGKRKVSFRKDVVLKNYLRARFDKANHFYIGDWHVETRPLSWKKEQNLLKMELSFFKRYGDDRSLEDYVGKMEVSGIAKGSNYVYLFETHKKMIFRNKHGHPIVDVEVGPISNKKNATVAKRKKR